jgi:hypothetical protein
MVPMTWRCDAYLSCLGALGDLLVVRRDIKHGLSGGRVYDMRGHLSRLVGAPHPVIMVSVQRRHSFLFSSYRLTPSMGSGGSTVKLLNRRDETVRFQTETVPRNGQQADAPQLVIFSAAAFSPAM